MMSLRSLIAFAIILVVSQQQSGCDAKSLSKNQVKFKRLPPKEFSAALGSSITVECEAGGSPSPTIHWLKDGKRIYLNELEANQLEDLDQAARLPVDEVNRNPVGITRSRLYIDCADFSDEATYTCVAENAYSRISSHTKLNLIRPAVQLVPTGPAPPMAGDENDLSALSELGGDGGGGGGQPPARNNVELAAIPQCLSDRLTGGAAPQAPVRIHMWSYAMFEMLKNNVIIYCRSNVNRQSQVSSKSQQQQQQQQQDLPLGMAPLSAATTLPALATKTDGPSGRPATILWKLPDDKLVSEELKDKYEILETGDLLIKDLRWSDVGQYECTVSDERGSDSVQTIVYPGSPSKPAGGGGGGGSKRSTGGWNIR